MTNGGRGHAVRAQSFRRESYGAAPESQSLADCQGSYASKFLAHKLADHYMAGERESLLQVAVACFPSWVVALVPPR
jgi:glutathione S-transferase